MAPGFGEIAARLRRSIVHLEGGAGVVWSADGTIITNAHVAAGPRAAVETWDGRRFDAHVAARDPRRDLAQLRVDARLEAPEFRDSSLVRPGELVVAIGNPLGVAGALSAGVVHGVGRWIEAAVRLAPGNSGGPLADARGQVIGINAMVAGGLGLAIPTNTVAAFLHPPARIGVTVRPIANGWLVPEIEPGSPAEYAGLYPGDILLDDLPSAIAAARDTVRLRVQRAGGPVRETVVELRARAAA